MRSVNIIGFVVCTAVASAGCIDSIAAPDAGLHHDAGHAMDVVTHVDTGNTSDTLTSVDMPTPIDAGMDSTVLMDAPHTDVPRDAGPSDVPQPAIALSGVATAMAFNSTTGSVYIALACNGGGGVPGCSSLTVGEQAALGIAVIDANTDMVSASLPPLTAPPGATGSSVYNTLAVDPVANVIYVAAGSDFIWTINGTANVVSGTITAGLSGLAVEALAVDPVAQRLYVAAVSPSAVQTLVVLNTATDTVVGTPTVLTGLSSVYNLSLDTAHGRLFVCDSAPDFATVDTSTDAQIGGGPTLTYAGQGPTVGCDGLSGFAEMVTSGSDGGAGEVHALDPADQLLPTDFTPITAVTVRFAGSTVATYVFGSRQGESHVAWCYVEWTQGSDVIVGTGGPTVNVVTPGDPINAARVIRTGTTTFDTYVVTSSVVSAALPDGGMMTVPSVSTVNRLTIPIPPVL